MKIIPSLILSFILLGLWSCSDAGEPLSNDCTEELDCAEECGGSAVVDECGECGGSGLNSDGCCGDTMDCIKYSTQIQPIFDNNCIICHKSGHDSGLNLSPNTSHTSLISNDVIVSGDHTSSKLWEYINTGYMPMGSGNSLSTDKINLIAQWIDQGVLDN